MACTKGPRRSDPLAGRSSSLDPTFLWRGLVRRWDGWRFACDAHRLIADPALRWSERSEGEVSHEEIEPIAADAREWRAIAAQLDEIKALRFFDEEKWNGWKASAPALPRARSGSSLPEAGMSGCEADGPGDANGDAAGARNRSD